MPPDPAEAVALFRFHLIAEASDPRLGPAERGRIVRSLAEVTHLHPDGSLRAYSRGTLDRWVRSYKEEGLAGLRPVPRSDTGTVRSHPELLAEAGALRAELASRSSAHIADIIWRRHGVHVAPRTIRTHLRARGLSQASLSGSPRVFGRYEADRANERWIGDVVRHEAP